MARKRPVKTRTRPTGCPLCKMCTLRERGGKVTKRCKWE